MPQLKDKMRGFFSRLNLSQRFMLAGSVILLLGMLGIGAWVEQQIETGVVHRTGATTALYVDSFVAPQLQGLGASEELLPEHVDALSGLIQDTPIGQQFVAFRVWSPKGRLLFTTDQSTVGKLYPMHEGMLRARLGEVVSEVSTLQDVENALLAAEYDRLLETYSPVWLSGTNRIIAVAEFYQLTDELDAEVGALKARSWLVVGLAILLMFILLSGFVRRASDTISRQQRELAQQVTQLTAILKQNRELHGRVRRAAASVALLNESNLRRIGSELHDGPAQDLGLSLLKLDEVAGKLEAQPPGTLVPGVLDQVGTVQVSLGNALKEMRAIAAGASLPQLAELSLTETVVRAVHAHQRRTGTQVALTLDNVPDQAALPVRITVYRLIQEALNNSFRHAGAAGQAVHVRGEGDALAVEIVDTGGGFQPEVVEQQDGHLGLAGMRERVESLGGQFSIESGPGRGTRVSATLPREPEGDDIL
jgi:signal transduction histidine kinase